MKKIGLILFYLLLLNGCTLIFKGTNQEVTFKSNVDGARVVSNLDSIGYTNHKINIPKSNLNKLYTISKEGCKDTSFVLPIYNEGLIWVDVALAGFPAFISMAMDSHTKTDKVIKVDLDCSGE